MKVHGSFKTYLPLACLVGWIALVPLQPVFAQMTPEEAAQHLAARQAAEAAAATQPAPITGAELRDLRAQLAALKRENTELKKANADLGAKLATLKAQMDAATASSEGQKDKDKPPKRTPGGPFVFQKPTLGMTEKDFLALLDDDFGGDLTSETASRKVYHMYTSGNLAARDTDYVTIVIEGGVIAEIDK